MISGKYRKKSEIILAFQYDGSENFDDMPAWMENARADGRAYMKEYYDKPKLHLMVMTDAHLPAGVHEGDWVVRLNESGYFLVYRNEEFMSTYEPAGD